MYFHRIGRTARAGATGKAISLVSQDGVDDFSRILKKTKQPILRLNEGMGITIPIVKQRPYDRYPQGRSYLHENGGHGNRGHRGDDRNKRSFRKHRGDNRNSRYGVRSGRRYH